QQFRVHMNVDGPDADQQAMIAEHFTKRCPIYTTLIQAAPIEITFNDEAMAGPYAEGLATSTIETTLTNQPGRAFVNVRGNYSVVDSVPPLGGPNEAVNPLDLLLAAQGTCGTFIAEKAALDMDIPLDGASLGIEVDFDPKGVKDGSVSPHIQAMRVNWEMSGVDDAQADTIVNEWLKRCPIYNTLKRATDITVMIDGETMAMADQ
ncbi:MAG: OsmC family protein, partial [Chloroflexota bacterium]